MYCRNYHLCHQLELQIALCQGVGFTTDVSAVSRSGVVADVQHRALAMQSCVAHINELVNQMIP